MHIIEETDDVSKFVPNLTGPAVQVEIHDPRGGSEKVIVYANHPELNIQHAKEHNGGLVLQYKGANKKCTLAFKWQKTLVCGSFG